jgi:hypothetical protein
MYCIINQNARGTNMSIVDSSYGLLHSTNAERKKRVNVQVSTHVRVVSSCSSTNRNLLRRTIAHRIHATTSIYGPLSTLDFTLALTWSEACSTKRCGAWRKNSRYRYRVGSSGYKARRDLHINISGVTYTTCSTRHVRITAVANRVSFSLLERF